MKKVLDFDDRSYKRALQDLEGHKATAEYLQRAYNMQEVLQEEEFTDSHYSSMLSNGNHYIKESVAKKIFDNWEAVGKGMGSQAPKNPYVDLSYDQDRLDRLTGRDSSGRSPDPESSHTNPRMVTFQKGKAVIPEEVKKGLKEQFCIYDDNPMYKEIYELGITTEACLNAIQAIINRHAAQREQQTGMKLARDIKIFKPKGVQPGEPVGDSKGVFYMNLEGIWCFNLRKFKLF